MLKVFDYYCINCDTTVEKFVKASEKDSQTCKECDCPVERKMPAPAGSGNAYHGFMKKGK